MSVENALELVERGQQFLDSGELEKSARCYMRAYSIFLSRNKKNYLRDISFILELIAQKMKEKAKDLKEAYQYENAAECLSIAYEIYNTLNNIEECKNVIFEIGLLAISLRDEAHEFMKNNSYQEALRNLNLALGLSRKIDDERGEGITLLQIAKVLAIMGKVNMSLKRFDEAISVLEKYNEHQMVLDTLFEAMQHSQGDSAKYLEEKIKKLAKDWNKNSFLKKLERSKA
ncbi:MAG: hypothetical protein QXL15_01755 [Candidatus Korarchaeota archaeon]